MIINLQRDATNILNKEKNLVNLDSTILIEGTVCARNETSTIRDSENKYNKDLPSRELAV